jgi:acyl-CoA thioester hydrolase
VPPVYTAHVTVRHDELDRFGRVHPAAYLRYLAHAAVEASTAAGFDPAWYVAAGAMWLVRRSTLEVASPAHGAERLQIETWVEDFRRVRSHRRYRVRHADGGACLEARTDWVYVDAASGRPRRVPAEFEAAFGLPPGSAQERDGWEVPARPATAALSSHRVRACEVDAVGHVNNAVYLDLVEQAMLDALEHVGWSLDGLIAGGAVPVIDRADLEYLEGAVYGDRIDVATWCTVTDGALDAFHEIRRTGADRLLVRAATRWHWLEPGSGARRGLPETVLAALRPLLAAS